jgi:EmrB/QacA subfamily drug resistance transporter
VRGADASGSRWVSLAGICTAAGLVWLAFADLGVAIPTIADDLGADMSALQWANNAFSLVTGALVIAAGKFGDVFGRRRMLLLGIVVFAASSIVAALAQGATLLIVGRGLMGIGAALMLPATLALIPPQFSGKAEITAFGAWQAVAWGGQAVGPAVGGVVTEGLGWSWLFWLNLPLAAIAYLVVRAVTPESSDPEASSHVDWPGLVTIGAAVFCLLYALTAGPDRGFGDPLIVGLLVAAAALAVAWCLIEARVRDPLVDLQLFSSRPYDGALTANLTMNLAFAGLSFLLVLWLQKVRGYDPVDAGLLMLPATLGIFVFIPLGGRLDLRRGSRLPVLGGLVVMSAGVSLLGLLTADTSLWVLAVALVVLGLGLGLLSTPISSTAVGGVSKALAGTAAGVFKMSSMVGGALGVALLTALARSYGTHAAPASAHDAGMTDQQIDRAQRALVDSGSFEAAIRNLPADAQRAFTEGAQAAFSSGVADALLTTGLLAFAATIVVAFLWPRPRRTQPSEVPKGLRSVGAGGGVRTEALFEERNDHVRKR